MGCQEGSQRSKYSCGLGDAVGEVFVVGEVVSYNHTKVSELRGERDLRAIGESGQCCVGSGTGCMLFGDVEDFGFGF